jgi:hypothetical protein
MVRAGQIGHAVVLREEVSQMECNVMTTTGKTTSLEGVDVFFFVFLRVASTAPKNFFA